jgi:simple sugar transport system substrate-binding protein
VQNAIDSKVSGIAVTLSNADAVIPVAKKATDAGIPVVVFNQGITDTTKVGSKMYFGSDETLAGQTIGQKIAQEDPGGKTLCVIQAQGLGGVGGALRRGEVRLRQHRRSSTSTAPTCRRCSRRSSPSWPRTSRSRTSSPSARRIAGGAAGPVVGLGNTAKVVTFDLNQDAAQAIKDGRSSSRCGQQPYVQGYNVGHDAVDVHHQRN